MNRHINYISNLDVKNVGGGWSSFNKNVYDLLRDFTTVNLVDAINPPFSMVQRIVSKAQRTLGIPALFPAFSLQRLKSVASLVESKVDNTASLNFYHGSTPWLLVKNKLPYVCYLDASFNSYLSVYHKGQSFNVSEIFALEKKFLGKAAAVFFSSRYALEQTKKDYDMAGENFHVAGLGGNLSYAGELGQTEKNRFVFIGHDFHGKGGGLTAEAFKKFSESSPGFHLTFMGGQPPQEVLEIPNVEYIGFLDKRKENELKRYQDLLTNAFALVLPTNRDMTPLVILEAGYCGCPSIASNAYGIPEMIGEAGCLVDLPIEVGKLADAMMSVKNKKRDPQVIRDFYIRNFTWESSGVKIRAVLDGIG